MESSEDKHWASKYLLDPLNAPEPNEETGPGSNLNTQTTLPSRSKAESSSQGKASPTVTVRSTAPSEQKTPASSVRSTTNPYRQSAHTSTGYPSPPLSTTSSPRASRLPASDTASEGNTNRFSQASTQIPTSTAGHNTASSVNGSGSANGTNNSNNGRPHRRNSSLTKRHPGDLTHRPLDMLRQEAKAADRAPHLKKKHLVGADSIDVLDSVGPPGSLAYHHEGPYDATLLARNTSYTNSPLEAVRGGNEQALKATPAEMINDSVTKHRPLDGTAVVPPGEPDQYGRVLDYEEGGNMMTEGQPAGGAYRRWSGINYLPDDIKGKGEPSYSLEKALKASKHSSHRRIFSESQANAGGATSIEMTPKSPTSHHSRRPMSADGGGHASANAVGGGVGGGERYADWEANGSGSGLGRTGSLGGKLRRRIGSLRGRKE